MRSVSCLLALVVAGHPSFTVALADADITPQEFDGGWRTVNTTDPEIIKLAQFSVSEHNKEAKTKLVFERVVSGRSALLFGGTYYELIVKAKDESLPKASAASYKGILFYKYNPWKMILQVKTFRKIKD
ncbi:hypothetical protein ACFX2I_019615 [Malus domestica]